MLVEQQRRLFVIPGLGRRWTCITSDRRHCARPGSRCHLDILSLSLQALSLISRLPMGYSAARDGVPGHFCRSNRTPSAIPARRRTISYHPVAALVVIVSSDVFFGRG